MKEEWKPIPGWEGLYEVSSQGRVRSLDRYVACCGGAKRLVRGQLRKFVKQTRQDSVEYWTVTLSKENKVSCCFVHRLVAIAFLGPCPKNLEVCHGCLGTLVNKVENLRYDTHSYNEHDKKRDGTSCCRPVKNSKGETFHSITDASKNTGCPISKIWEVCNGRRKHTLGLQWEYC